MLAHAESLRVTNSLLAARIDQLNLQSKYLMQDQKKVGPNLKDVRLKLRKEWVPVWLKDPQAFRPGTKMPTFWRFAEHREWHGVQRDNDAADQIKAISAYLWQESFDGKAAGTGARRRGPRQRAFRNSRLSRLSLNRRGRQHDGRRLCRKPSTGRREGKLRIHRALDSQPARTLGALLSEREARSDAGRLQRSTTSRTFSILSCIRRCPNDGAELQVQNMTVMPNFRLSEATRATSPLICSRSPSPPSYPDASFMDDPNLKRKGTALIKQYGCAGCHEIKGFEEEQRIGKELTVEGATPIERLDFALLTHDAEKGHDPLEAPAPSRSTQEKPWYNHKGFFEHKLAEPSIYDRGQREGSERQAAHAEAISDAGMAQRA